MRTEIYESYSAFLERDDKTLNGVTTQFATDNPNYSKERGNESCWNCSDCSRCSRCSGCSDCSRCSDCFDCSGCSRCSGCSGCFDCSGCSDCSGSSGCFDCSRCSRCSRCSGCSDCFGLKNAKPTEASAADNPLANIPVIPNIHQQLLAAVTNPDHKLKMSDWHTCETAHCRGGWIVSLSGPAGWELEKITTTEFAAMQIYKASSPIRVSPVRFYETDEAAMADIKRCAAEEAALAK